MNAHSIIDATNLHSTNPGRILANGLRGAAPILTAATPAFAKQGDAQDMLATAGDHGITNKTADSSEYYHCICP